VLRKCTGLLALLRDMEQRGEPSASALSDYRDPWREQLEALGIQSVHGIEGSARPGAVYVMNDVVASYGWVQPGRPTARRAPNRASLAGRQLNRAGRRCFRRPPGDPQARQSGSRRPAQACWLFQLTAHLS
jgi:hypothetical protein